MKVYNAVIIGGGISGLGCGRRLHKARKDFVLLTKDVGGRMLTSKNQKTDYGASYLTEDYTNTLQFLRKGEALPASDCYFLHNKEFRPVWSIKNLVLFPALIEFYMRVRDFRRRILRFRERSLQMSQKQALGMDPVLTEYVKMPATTFVREHNLGKINKYYAGALFHSTMFTNYTKANAFYYLAVLIPFVSKTYAIDFRQTIPRLTKAWERRVKQATVTKVSKQSNGTYRISSSKGTYQARNVVLALPYPDARKIHKIAKPHRTIPIFVIHVKGKRKERYQDKKVIFFGRHKHDISLLWGQPDKSDIVFTHKRVPKLDTFFESHKVVKRVYWRSAVTISDKHWVEQELDDGLYLASDYNVAGIEDAYITGVYAANQIIKKA